MRATWKGQLLAESDDTVVVEGNHYFPAASLQRERFRESATHSVCPWKGTASYYDIVVGGDVNRDAAWYYPSPKPKAANISGRVAFWKGVEVAALALLLLLGAAAPATALENLAGFWAGRPSCQGIDDGVKNRGKEIAIGGFNDAGDGSVSIQLDNLVSIGHVEVDAARPDQGVLAALSCDFNAVTQNGYVLHANLRTKAGSVKATLVGTLIFMNAPSGAISICDLQLERADLKAQPIACPN